MMQLLGRVLAAIGLGLFATLVPIFARAAEPRRIGYTEFRTNLPGGRHANVRTMRAAIVHDDGTGRTRVGDELAVEPDAWTQFAGWSPDGQCAILAVGWQSPDNARWEEEHRQFRHEAGKWKMDIHLYDLATRRSTNLTAIERVSHYNAGLFFLPGGKQLGFTAIIKGESRPFVMDRDGRNKRDVSGDGAGFAYGYNPSPDGRHIVYHQNYQLFVSTADGSNKKHLATGLSFNFVPQWSPDGSLLLFLGGAHHDCHPHLIRPDGSGLRKLADRQGYKGTTAFLDVFDFHDGSSDLPVWSRDGKQVYYTAQVGQRVELFSVTREGSVARLTHSGKGVTFYHPQPSPDGMQLVYGSMREGVRNLYVRRLADGTERPITAMMPGSAAMWPHWHPADTGAR